MTMQKSIAPSFSDCLAANNIFSAAMSGCALTSVS
jgi:hypothetical protein